MEIKLYKSAWRAIRLMLLCSVFVIPSIFLSPETDATPWVNWFIIGFFGLGYPIGLFNLLDRRPQVIINEIGIFDRMMFADFIPWEVIQDAYLLSISRQKFICLVVEKQYEPSRKKRWFVRTMYTVNKDLGAQELNIVLGHIAINEKKLLSFILQMIKTTPEGRKANIQNGLRYFPRV
jgi:hypothetical protein